VDEELMKRCADADMQWMTCCRLDDLLQRSDDLLAAVVYPLTISTKILVFSHIQEMWEKRDMGEE